MLSKIISSDSLGTLPDANSSNNSMMCSGFNSVASSPCLSRFVILEQSIEATKFGKFFLFSQIFSNGSMYSESKICSDNCGFRGRGDQYVRLVVNIPKKLNNHQKDLLKELDDSFD